MKRNEIYRRIDGERNYQDKKWGGRSNDEKNSMNDWISYMELCLDKANFASTHQESLDELRQVVALGIACMEIHGVPERKNS